MKRSTALNRIGEHLMMAYLAALAGGLILVYSASSVIASGRYGSNFYFFKQQFIWAILSVVVIWVISKLDLKKLAVYSAPALFVMLLLLSLVFIMPARNGAHRWLELGPLTGQPSELFKLVMIFFLAFSLSNPKRNLSNLKQLLFPYLPLIGVGLLLILAEPDLGTAIVIVVTALMLFFLAGARLKHLAIGILPAIAGAASVVFILGYKKDRILDYVAAIGDPLKGSYQSMQAALTFGAGGFAGTGLGNGSQKLYFLPYPHTDFIFASAGEEIGLIGTFAIIGLLFFILTRGLKIAATQPDKFGYLLAAGMTLSLFVNIAVNLGVVTSLLPVTGLALPFFSYGGSSLLVSAAAIGVLINLSRRVTTNQWQRKRLG